MSILITRREAAERAGCSTFLIDKAIRNREITVVRLGEKKILVAQHSLSRWIRRRTIRAGAPDDAQSQAAEGEPPAAA